MAVQGATGRVTITGALVSLAVAGIAAAASPGPLSSSDPAWWLLRHPKDARGPRERHERQKIPPLTLLIFLVLAAGHGPRGRGHRAFRGCSRVAASRWADGSEHAALTL